MHALRSIGSLLLGLSLTFGCGGSKSAERDDDSPSEENSERSSAAGDDESSKSEGDGEVEKERKRGTAPRSSETAGDRSDPRIDLGEPAQSAGGGTLESDQIEDVFRRHEASIRKCYRQGLDSNASAAGKIVVALTVESDGSVEGVEAAVDSVGSGVGECLVKVVEEAEFPEPDGGDAMVKKTVLFETN